MKNSSTGFVRLVGEGRVKGGGEVCLKQKIGIPVVHIACCACHSKVGLIQNVVIQYLKTSNVTLFPSSPVFLSQMYF